jgi:hypothetical protein
VSTLRSVALNLQHQDRWLLRPSRLLFWLGVGLFPYGLTQPMSGFGRSRGNWYLLIAALAFIGAGFARDWENDAITESDEHDLAGEDSAVSQTPAADSGKDIEQH